MPCEFGMVEGVMGVWADDSRQQQLYAIPGTAVEFFSGGGRKKERLGGRLAGGLGCGGGECLLVSLCVWPMQCSNRAWMCKCAGK